MRPAAAAEAVASEVALGELGHGFEAGQRAFLELEINGVRKGEVLVFVRGADYWVDLESLKEAGIRDRGDGERLMIDGRMVVRIGSLAPHVSAVLDEAALVLRLTVNPALLGRTVLDMSPARPLNIQYRRDASAFLNYGATWSSTDDHLLSLETGLNAGPGLFTGYVSATPAGFVRGPLSLTMDSRERLRRWIIGDSVASGGALGGAAQLAGLNVSSNYNLDPYFIRFPTVGLTGALSAPSTVDVYVNDRLVRREQLPPGAFDLQSLPLPVGASSARVVMRDAFGREQEISGSFYLSSGLLAPGLHQYQYAVGAERERSAFENWSYGAPTAFGLHRVGLSDSLTVGGRIEATDGLVSTGPHVVARLWSLGEVEASGGWSRQGSRTGFAWSTGYFYTNRSVTFGGSLRRVDRHYVTTSTRLISTERLAFESGLTVGTRVGRRANLSVAYQGRRFHSERPSENLVSLSARMRLAARSALSLTVSRSEVGGVISPAVFAGMTVGVGSRDLVGASTHYRDDRSRTAVELQRSMPVGEGFGYHVRAETGGHASFDADVRAQSRYGLYDVRHHDLGDRRLTSATAAGALVAIGGRLFATRPVQESFALVRVPNVRSVRTYLSNQEIGRTDGSGHLLVPNLLAYYGNRLTIADEDVPLNRTISTRELTMAPPYRGGVIAEFPVVRETRVTGSVVLRRGMGTIVPSFGRALTEGTDGAVVESFLGPAGEFYLEGLAIGENRVRIEYSDMQCEFTLAIPETDEAVIAAGVVTCLLL